MLQKRGAFIVVEGGDRCGKTTFCRGLVERLKFSGVTAQYLNFPDRTTDIGKMIDKYLRSKDAICNDETIHLLFSANRWEWASKIKNLLNEGTTLIVDRYAFSGVAFSAAKGLDFKWCKSPDMGLPKPDRVYLLQLDPNMQELREGFGEERYDVTSFQKKVFSYYLQMTDSSWVTLNASRTADDLQLEETSSIVDLTKHIQTKEVERLWI